MKKNNTILELSYDDISILSIPRIINKDIKNDIKILSIIKITDKY